MANTKLDLNTNAVPAAESTHPSGLGADAQLYVSRPSFTVPFEYPVLFTENVFDPANPVLVSAISRLEPDRRHKLIVFVDQGVAANWPQLNCAIESYTQGHADQLALVSDPQIVPGGEQCKCDDSLLDDIYRRLHRFGVDRQSVVMCIGGGAVLDLVGYAAANAHRGIRLVRLPTTVLAQNDAGVGVKNGINKFGIKNFVGTFQPPFAVISDFQFLNTLEPRDRRAGIAEAIKVALIRDAAFFESLEANHEPLASFERESTEYMIKKCAQLHLAQITQGGDPFETGSARPLDFGHWSAHKLESLSNHRLRHGEAVAIGMMLDARYAVESGLLRSGTDIRIFDLLNNLGFDLWHETLEQLDDAGRLCLLRGLEEFREHLGGELTVTLPIEVGTGIEVHHMDEKTIRQAADWLREQYAPA